MNATARQRRGAADCVLRMANNPPLLWKSLWASAVALAPSRVFWRFALDCLSFEQ
jgi:hypothetical protein